MRGPDLEMTLGRSERSLSAHGTQEVSSSNLLVPYQ